MDSDLRWNWFYKIEGTAGELKADGSSCICWSIIVWIIIFISAAGERFSVRHRGSVSWGDCSSCSMYKPGSNGTGSPAPKWVTITEVLGQPASQKCHGCGSLLSFPVLLWRFASSCVTFPAFMIALIRFTCFWWASCVFSGLFPAQCFWFVSACFFWFQLFWTPLSYWSLLVGFEQPSSVQWQKHRISFPFCFYHDQSTVKYVRLAAFTITIPAAFSLFPVKRKIVNFHCRVGDAIQRWTEVEAEVSDGIFCNLPSPPLVLNAPTYNVAPSSLMEGAHIFVQTVKKNKLRCGSCTLAPNCSL